jgi:3-keto steroid reductase
LVNLLQKSPSTLQFAPRIIHTSSRTAAFSALNDDILADPQLVQAPRTYAASKYLATLMMSHFDREYGNPKTESTSPVPAVRCLNVDPGAVQTNVMDEGFRAEGAGLAIYIAIMRWGYWLAFVIVSPFPYERIS